MKKLLLLILPLVALVTTTVSAETAGRNITADTPIIWNSQVVKNAIERTINEGTFNFNDWPSMRLNFQSIIKSIFVEQSELSLRTIVNRCIYIVNDTVNPFRVSCKDFVWFLIEENNNFAKQKVITIDLQDKVYTEDKRFYVGKNDVVTTLEKGGKCQYAVYKTETDTKFAECKDVLFLDDWLSIYFQYIDFSTDKERYFMLTCSYDGTDCSLKVSKEWSQLFTDDEKFVYHSYQICTVKEADNPYNPFSRIGDEILVNTLFEGAKQYWLAKSSDENIYEFNVVHNHGEAFSLSYKDRTNEFKSLAPRGNMCLSYYDKDLETMKRYVSNRIVHVDVKKGLEHYIKNINSSEHLKKVIDTLSKQKTEKRKPLSVAISFDELNSLTNSICTEKLDKKASEYVTAAEEAIRCARKNFFDLDKFKNQTADDRTEAENMIRSDISLACPNTNTGNILCDLTEKKRNSLTCYWQSWREEFKFKKISKNKK